MVLRAVSALAIVVGVLCSFKWTVAADHYSSQKRITFTPFGFKKYIMSFDNKFQFPVVYVKSVFKHNQLRPRAIGSNLVDSPILHADVNNGHIVAPNDNEFQSKAIIPQSSGADDEELFQNFQVNNDDNRKTQRVGSSNTNNFVNVPQRQPQPPSPPIQQLPAREPQREQQRRRVFVEAPSQHTQPLFSFDLPKGEGIRNIVTYATGNVLKIVGPSSSRPTSFTQITNNEQNNDEATVNNDIVPGSALYKIISNSRNAAAAATSNNNNDPPARRRLTDKQFIKYFRVSQSPLDPVRTLQRRKASFDRYNDLISRTLYRGRPLGPIVPTSISRSQRWFEALAPRLVRGFATRILQPEGKRNKDLRKAVPVANQFEVRTTVNVPKKVDDSRFQSTITKTNTAFAYDSATGNGHFYEISPDRMHSEAEVPKKRIRIAFSPFSVVAGQ